MSQTIGEAVKLAYEHEGKINDILNNYMTTDTPQTVTGAKYFPNGKAIFENYVIANGYTISFPQRNGEIALASDIDSIRANYVAWIQGIPSVTYGSEIVSYVFYVYNDRNQSSQNILQNFSFNILSANTSQAGLMSAADKVKVNNIASDIAAALSTANSYTDDKTNRTYLVNTIGEATTSQSGLLSAADKTKVNNIAGDISTALNAAKTYTDSKVARENLVAVLGEATTTLNGLMSATDKERLNTLYALLGESGDPDQFVNTISEILEVFETYPEGTDIATVLAGKMNYSDVVDNLNSNETVKPLSANQGRILKGMVDQKVSSYSNAPTQWDTTPTSGSTKPVTSGGVKAADDVLAADITALDGRTDNLETAVTGLENNKADKSDTFNKTETEALLAGKQPVGDYATNDDLNDLETRVSEVEENKADVDGNYPTMSVGYAENAGNLIATKGLTVNDDPMSFGVVGGEQKSAVSDGNATLNKLVCVDVVRNQLEKIRTQGTKTFYGVTVTYNTDGTITLNGEYNGASTDNVFLVIGNDILRGKANHKYLQLIDIISGSISAAFYCGWSDGKLGDSYINTAAPYNYRKISSSSDSGNYGVFGCYINGVSHPVFDNYTVRIRIVDLTQRYGNNDVVNAVIGTTASEQVNRLFAFDPKILNNTDYDIGTLVPSKSAKLLSVGVNQWDEKWAKGSITGNGSVTQPGTIYGTSYIHCLPDTTYYSNVILRFAYYDANKAFLFRDENNGTVHIIPSNARFFRLTMPGAYGDTYKNDICINIFDSSINGKYYPYKENPVAIPNYEGHGILKVVDGKVVADGTELYPNGKSKKRYTVVDLGTLNYFRAADNLWSTPKRDAKYVEHSISYNTITSNGLKVRIYRAVEATYLGVEASTTEYTAETFKQSVSGVYLVYPLATEEDITTTVYQSNFPVEQGGTLQFLDENDNPIAGLQGSEIFYQKNIKTFVEAFGESIAWNPERIERLANLSFTPEYVDIALNPSPTGAYARAQVYNATFTIVISAALTGTASGSITFQDSEVDLTNFQTKPSDSIYDMDGKKVSEAPTTIDCNIASFVGRSKNGIILWSLLHSGTNKIKIHIEEAVPLDSEGNGKIDCRASLIL